jgi:hypothetical protein
VAARAAQAELTPAAKEANDARALRVHRSHRHGSRARWRGCDVTAAEALAFVERHNIVLEASRRGEVPTLADAIAGEAVRGSWWSHPQGCTIFAATRAVRASPAVLVCRIVDGKLGFVHRHLWPALARLAGRFEPKRLARLREVHTPSCRHRIEEAPFPAWLDPAAREAANALGEEAALAAHATLRACAEASP